MPIKRQPVIMDPASGGVITLAELIEFGRNAEAAGVPGSQPVKGLVRFTGHVKRLSVDVPQRGADGASAVG